jgi:hypothetical protein
VGPRIVFQALEKSKLSNTSGVEPRLLGCLAHISSLYRRSWDVLMFYWIVFRNFRTKDMLLALND